MKKHNEQLKARQSFNGTWYVELSESRKVVKTGLTEGEAKRMAA
jgi:hypothetical protein